MRLTVPRGTELLLDDRVKEEGRYGILYEVRIGNPGRCEVLSEVRKQVLGVFLRAAVM